MQCTTFHRDPYENAAWQLYLRECTLRAAREEVAFLEATGGLSSQDLARIRDRVMGSQMKQEDCAVQQYSMMPPVVVSSPPISTPQSVTVSLKSILTDVVQSDAVNQLCRRVRPILEQQGIVTFKKHQAVHVLQADAQRVRDVGVGLIGTPLM